MIPSIKGGWLPESAEDFEVLVLGKGAPHLRCFICEQPIGPANVRTEAGWRETQISGTCEDCFDKLMHDGEAQDSGIDTLY